ncbi:Ig-like domain-containing alpha-2-macroglobulin family protein [Petrocella sp. FN5]|uniref:Ig-like domain-containing alpha-2-macroglobulin family protein n=1 Tax=Petrocella sp. FN5 TaxID=3032002 RepID=UPI0023DAE175|nr:Ig-like domain-containing alpha-2-macroglobulin family protein [Petrocella sp. FN5]MDF1617685.1 alpha-2-macroglobulin family protein [Petrocella sp. FN5]
MDKRVIISFTMIVVMITGLFGYQYFTGNNSGYVYAESFRDGVSLTPTKIDSRGIDVTTTFLIGFEEGKEMTLDEIKEQLIIKPEVVFDLEEVDEQLVLSFAKPLEENQVYKFLVGNTSWVFQTKSLFTLVGNLPRHQATGVPTDSGIELYFNGKVKDLSQYFVIEPRVNGYFESYGNTMVFVPRKLEPETLYTVTVKAGLPLEGSGETLTKNHVFSFETTSTDSGLFKEPKGYFNYRRLLNDFSSKESLFIPFNFSIYDKNADMKITSEVYAYDSIERFSEAIKDYGNYPIWSNFNQMPEESGTSGLKKVLEFEQNLESPDGYEDNLRLPTMLEPGFYVVQSSWEDMQFQTFLQITDLSYYYFADHTQGYFWMHDLGTQKPASGAKVSIMGTSTTAIANQEGLAVFKDNTTDDMAFYHLSYNNMESLNYQYKGYRYDQQDYWTYFQTDRGLYQPDDEVAFFGFLQNRETGDYPNKVRVEVTKQNWFFRSYWPGMDKQIPLIKKDVQLENGFYKGGLELPNLEPGSYQMNIMMDDQTLASHYITVDKYVKPDYKMDLIKDKEAIFVDESLNIKVNTSFFEGTPVSGVNVQYNVYGIGHAEGQITTDLVGNAQFVYTPVYQEGYQGDHYGGINIFATLPESGEIHHSENIRIFANDIHVGIETTLKETDATIKANVNKITLERLNNGTAEDSNDFLGQGVQGHVIKGIVKKNEWVKTEVGESYDFIHKVVVKKYEYNLVTTDYQAVELKTNSLGVAEVKLTLPKEDFVHYSLVTQTQDTNGRKIEQTHYFNNHDFFEYVADNRVYIEADQESYDLDETMKLSLKDKAGNLAGFQYLTMFGTDGVKEIKITDQPSLDTTYKKVFMPNVEVTGVSFTGETYLTTEGLNIGVNKERFKVDLKVTTDQTTYKPGEEVIIEVKATYKDEDGTTRNLPSGIANLSIVDEALFTLNEQEINVLESLYGMVSSGIHIKQGSHNNSNYPNGPIFAGLRGYGMMTESMDMAKTEVAPEQPTSMALDSATGNLSVRSEFKDTALFLNLKLNDQGYGKISFKLPDNVTAWRITTAALSESLYAGSEKKELKVTLPFFINPVMNRTYLVGDQPYVNVAGYGNAIKEDEIIEYEVASEDMDYTFSVTGKAFEKISLPLWKLEAGDYAIRITAKTETGLTDSYVETIHVKNTYQKMAVTDTYQATKNLKIETGLEGMTTLTFADRSAGQYISTLYNLYYSEGKRVDQIYLASVVQERLGSIFNIQLPDVEAQLSDYITDEGGITLLPYSEIDLATTVKLVNYLENDQQIAEVKAFLHNGLFKKNSGSRGLIIYGLARLGEPMLLELNDYVISGNLSFEDHIIVALAYGSLGDDFMAEKQYREFIKPHVEHFDNQARVVYANDEESQIKHSSMVLPLLAMLNDKDAPDMFNYVTSRHSKTYLNHLDLLHFIDIRLESANKNEATLTYRYDGVNYDVDFKDWWGASVTLPSAKMDAFEIVDVTSDVLVVAKYDSYDLIDREQDTKVSVSRSYEDYKTGEKKWNFKTGDIVKVIIDWKIDENAIDQSYTITDYAPSGLVPMENPWDIGLEDDYYWYRDIEDQSVKFGVYKDTENYRPMFYFARVISPGTFTADAPMIQGMLIKDSFNLGDRATVTIEP